MMDGCLAVQRLLLWVGGGSAAAFLPPVLSSSAPILIYLALRRWEALAFFFFLPLVYHKKISQSHAHLKSSTIQGRLGGRVGNRLDTAKM